VKEKRRIVDTTLRDGEQSPYISFSREQKLRIFAALDAAGVHQVETGVPAVSGYERDTILQMRRIRKQTKIAVWSRAHPDDIIQSLECEPDVLHFTVPVSYMHIYTKLRKNKDWMLGRVSECLDALSGASVEISVGYEDASRADFSFIMTLTRLLSERGVRRIRLADTVGTLTPSACRELAERFFKFADKSVEAGFHAHNDFGMALANTAEMLKSGVMWADTSLCGIGERAGNCDFFSLISTTSRIFDWGISSASALSAQREFEDAIYAR
jgi:homocitrate synthase NifV